jgi:hypothetical protein
VVLDHVAQRAGLVVVVAARAHAQALGERDLDVGDALAPPQRLEQGIAETQRQQVLHRRLAQVVVDAQRLRLGEHRAHDAVDLERARQVVAERLLEHHAHLRAVQADGAELLADDREQIGAGGQVEHDGVGATRVQPVLEAGVVLGLRQVHAPVVQQLGEARELLVARPLGRLDLGEALADEGAVGVVAALVARHRQDAAAAVGADRQLAVPEGLEQRRHQLAPGQVAGAAEEDEVEGHGARVRGTVVRVILLRAR